MSNKINPSVLFLRLTSQKELLEKRKVTFLLRLEKLLPKVNYIKLEQKSTLNRMVNNSNTVGMDDIRAPMLVFQNLLHYFEELTYL